MNLNQLDQIASLNNKGCHDLGQGCDAEAMRAFKSALTHLKFVIPPSHERGRKNDCTKGLLPLHADSLYRDFPLAGRRETIVECNYFIFSHAIPITKGHRFSQDETESNEILIGIVIFNLALTLHLRSLGNGCWRSLQKARSLYSKSYDLFAPILEEYYQGSQTTTNAACDLLFMALLNNMALIHLDFLDFARAGAAFQRLIIYATNISTFQASGGENLTAFVSRNSSVSLTRSGGNGNTLRGPAEDYNEERSLNNVDFFMEKVGSMLLNANFVKVAMISSVAPAA